MKAKKSKPASKPILSALDPDVILASLFQCKSRKQAALWLNEEIRTWESRYPHGFDTTRTVLLGWLRYFALKDSVQYNRLILLLPESK